MKRTILGSARVVALLLGIPVFISSAFAALPVPTGNQTWFYPGIVTPVLSDDPSAARPVGLGPVAVGGDVLTVQIGLNMFTAPVDIYGAYIVSADPSTVNVLNPGGGFTAFTLDQILTAITLGVPPAGANPWMSGVMGPINEQLLNTSLSNVPAGAYSVYLLVTPVGSFNDFYLWITLFNSP